MYSITVRDRCAYALSLKLGNAPLFRTGVTALVDAKLSGPELGPDGLLIDFVAVQLALGATLAPLQNADLDRLRPFAGSMDRVSFREGAPHLVSTAQAATRRPRSSPSSSATGSSPRSASCRACRPCT